MYISAQTSSGLKPDVLGANSSGHGLSGWCRFVKNAAIHRSRAFTFLAEAVVPQGHWCPGGLWESVGAGLGFTMMGTATGLYWVGATHVKYPMGTGQCPPDARAPLFRHTGAGTPSSSAVSSANKVPLPTVQGSSTSALWTSGVGGRGCCVIPCGRGCSVPSRISTSIPAPTH